MKDPLWRLLAQVEQLFQFFFVESDHDLIPDHRDRSREEAQLLEFVHRLGVFRDVTVFKLDVLFRKPRFLKATEVSTGL